MGAKSRREKQQITEANAKVLASRYEAGEGLAALARRAGVWTDTLRRAFKKLKIAIRPEDQTPRRCRLCGQPVKHGGQRPLCAAHVRRYCCRCEEPLPKGRVNVWCTACNQADDEERHARPNRRCPTCGGPLTGRVDECGACWRKRYLLEWQHRLRQPGHCLDCAALLPAGRVIPRCTDCHRRHIRRERTARRRLGLHRCQMCGEELPLKRASYCKGCDTMIANWRKAWHLKNPIARQLGTVKARKARQITSCAAGPSASPAAAAETPPERPDR